jgi:hypothetical protein
MTAEAAVPYFDKRAVDQILASLPPGIGQRRLDLLPRVLKHWSVTYLHEHLSRERPPILRRRYNQLTRIENCANNLRKALGALDQRGRSWIALEMAREGGDRFSIVEGETLRQMEEWHRLESEKLAEINERLTLEDDFLLKLGTATQRLVEEDKQGPGQPANVPAYLVMMDLAAIFEWLTGREATRVVDRIDKHETGHFWNFAAAVWPLVFGHGRKGLSAAMKNWEALRLKHNENSPFKLNVLRHLEWGVFTLVPE